MHAAEQVLLRLQPVQRRGRARAASARAESRARSAASWPRCARDAADRRGRCRRRARSRRAARRRARADCAAASASALPVATGRAVRRGDAHQPLAQLVEARRRDLVEHVAAPLLPLLDHRLADARDGALRRGAPFLPSSASNSNVTSSSRTGPSARVMRRTRFSRAIERLVIGARAQHRQRLAQPARRDAGLVHGDFVAGLRRRHRLQQRNESLAEQRDGEGRMLHARMSSQL